MVHEKDFEDIICKYPGLIEDGLRLIGRQLTVYGRRMDILFEDRFKRKLIIELKNGPIKDEHIGQLLSYEGMLLSAEDPTVRVMLVGTRVPPNIQKSLDHHGIAWKEITHSTLKEFLKEKEDMVFLNLFEKDEPILIKRENEQQKVIIKLENFVTMESPYFKIEDLINSFKKSDIYISFKSVLHEKIKNEEKAKTIIKKNLGRLNSGHLKDIIDLINYPYLCDCKGREGNRHPWFGRLLSKVNVQNILKEDKYKINQWFNVLSDNHISVEKKLDSLKKPPYKINGISTGFITLMLYLLDKQNNLIWFSEQHQGLRKVYPELDKFTGKGSQYIRFNDFAKKFARQFNFEHTELDCVLTRDLSKF